MRNPDLPNFSALSTVEKAYYDRIFSLSVTERVMIAIGLFDSIKRILEHQIRLRDPELNDREIRIRVAERMYLTEPGALKLLERMRQT